MNDKLDNPFEEYKKSDGASSNNFDKQFCHIKILEEKLLKVQKDLKLNIENFHSLQKKASFYQRKTKDIEDETVANVKKSVGLKNKISSLLKEEHDIYKNQTSFNTFPTATFYIKRMKMFEDNQQVPNQISCLDKHVLRLKKQILEVKDKSKKLSSDEFTNVNFEITKSESMLTLENETVNKKVLIQELEQKIKNKELEIKLLTKRFQAQKLRLRHQVAKKRAELEENLKEKPSPLSLPFRNRSAR